jgi:hypothetical protein
MISDIYDKQLVNLVNDNIKKSEHVDFNNKRLLTFIAVLLINSSYAFRYTLTGLSLKQCKWWR